MRQTRLSRRQFLIASLFGLASLAFPLSASASSDALPRSAEEQAIAQRLEASMGREYAVRSMRRWGNNWYARLDFQGLLIHLKSGDGQTWYTADWQPPAAV